jgi:hypothetical protein
MVYFWDEEMEIRGETIMVKILLIFFSKYPFWGKC